MRIIAGEFKGRRLRSPEDRRVRPTSDKVKEAVFQHAFPLSVRQYGSGSVCRNGKSRPGSDQPRGTKSVLFRPRPAQYHSDPG